MIRNLPNTLVTFRGKHTINNYSNFFIPYKNIDSAFMNIKLTCRNILTNNHLRVVDEASSILPLKHIPSPDGFTMCFLLDESHLSLHSYTNCEEERGEVIGKLALDLFTCSPNPLHHHNAIRDLSKFLIENYHCSLDSSLTIDRF
jgi:S-adenosylmethionine/arginine decarboxylase-like enzyme